MFLKMCACLKTYTIAIVDNQLFCTKKLKLLLTGKVLIENLFLEY